MILQIFKAWDLSLENNVYTLCKLQQATCSLLSHAVCVSINSFYRIFTNESSKTVTKQQFIFNINISTC